MYPSYGDIGRQQGMDDPEGRAQQGDVLDEDTLTLVEVDELWTQTIVGVEASLVHIHTVLS